MSAVWEEQNLYQRFCHTRQVAMEKDRRLFDDMRLEVVEYLRPDLTGNTDSDIGKQMGSCIVEGTGHFKAKDMSKWFIGNMVGPTLDWLSYKMADRRLKGADEINAFLQRSAEFMLEDVYAYPRSNFYEINNTFVLDGITVGSPVILLENDLENDRKICKLPHFTENFLMRDWFGSDIAYHRKWEIDNFSAMQAFGKSLPRSIQSELDQGQYDVKHMYLMCIARAGDPIFQYENMKPENRIPLIRPWMQLWFVKDSVDITEQKPLMYKFDSERGLNVPTTSPGYFHKPFHAWHYARLPHETYTRTPGWESLPDVKGLNAAWRSVHDTAHSYARPSVTALDSLKGRLQLGAEGITWVTNEEYDKPPIAFDNRSNYSWAMDFVERRTVTVGRHFFSDMARMIENYSQQHTQPPTAFQMSQMISETMVLAGPAITSYAGPYLSGIDDQFMEMEMRSGRFFAQTDPPEEAFSESGEILPVFRGPLLQQLRLAMLLKRIQQPLTMAAPIMDLWPDSKHKVNAVELLETLLESSDFPQKAIHSAEDYDEMMEAINTERRQMAELEKAKLTSEITKDLQGDTGEQSPLKQLGDAA